MCELVWGLGQLSPWSSVISISVCFCLPLTLFSHALPKLTYPPTNALSYYFDAAMRQSHTHAHSQTRTQTGAMLRLAVLLNSLKPRPHIALPSHKLHMLAPHSRVLPHNLIDPIFLHSLGSFNVWETSSDLIMSN